MTPLLPINEKLNTAALSLEEKLQTCGDPNFFYDLELLKEGTNVRSKCSSVEELTECGAYKFRSAWGMNILARKVIEPKFAGGPREAIREMVKEKMWFRPPTSDTYLSKGKKRQRH